MRAEEELGPYLSPAKQSYVFGALAPQAARYIMWLLPELQVRQSTQLEVPSPAIP